MKKLEDIAKVSFGNSISPDKYGEIPLILGRSISQEGNYLPEYNTFIPEYKMTENDYLNPDDLLFLAKGGFTTPYIVKENNLPAAASSAFFIIRLYENKIMPEFLAWYLMTPKSRHRINIISEGSIISSISIKEFRKFKIPVPNLKTQKKIIELQELQNNYVKHVGKLTKKVELLNNEISKRLLGE